MITESLRNGNAVSLSTAVASGFISWTLLGENSRAALKADTGGERSLPSFVSKYSSPGQMHMVTAVMAVVCKTLIRR